MKFFCADTPTDPSRRAEFALSVPPLARTLADSLFTVVFLFDDLVAKLQWYWAAGWRQLYEHHQTALARYGTDPRWKDWLAQRAAMVQTVPAQWGVDPAAVADPSTIRWWPNPGKMPKGLNGERKDFLTYLNDWFYKHLSGDSHLSAIGLARGHFLLDEKDDGRDEQLSLYRSTMFSTTVTLLLALISELECELRLGGLATRAQYVWTLIGDIFPPALELYDMRYRDRLNALSL